ncbi:MFS domain-containing protein [Schizosaccharomyces pombe]|uniref:Carboxylic acid transmembrane transporter SPBC1683.12 n=1 Tax=Schizosaccharomyces pombe (strain 972 / ATCC 24843) TaxID=284812 RepID=TNA12_SCHPO|nr:putative nicotinic acid plasma membrane transporter [Schizosaccharomyces pombe]Q9P6J0.1 RecName: Full=Uncharacterized transporter C1683.12 [Schizosaccharomyces pombe 972h-]CAB91174.1 nicotinic acid plasma membrane transporter (predicted) [Schizosaccharomyces pombe]|eukprot:NP_595068.1 putative nicotinic acid plasma membrane transporter [Schizosaccharomyces pombe]
MSTMEEEKVISKSTSVDISEGTFDDITIEKKEEAKLVRKLDWYLMPMFSVLYFLSFLDRANIGNAAVVGLKEDLKLQAYQYSAAVSVFYATYITAETPSVLLVKKFGPHYYLSAMIIGWSLVTIFTCFVRHYWSLVLTRLLLGICEGGFFPCLSLYISMTYKREEQGKRLAYLYVCSCFSGAFGGLIATGLTKIPKSSGLPNWGWLYIIEGLISAISALWILFCLPDDPSTARFLNPREKELMKIRAEQRQKYMGSPNFDWTQFRKAFKDPKMYMSCVIQFCQDLVLYGISTFLPSILKLELGYSSLAAQYMSVPVYALGGISVYVICLLSDRTNIRGWFIIGMNFFGLAGFIILLATTNSAANYVATYLIALPLYPTVALNITWINNNMAPHYRRATALGCNQTIGNLAGVIAGQVYRSSPYKLGHGFALGCTVVGTLTATAMRFYLQRQNKIKQEILNGERVDEKKERDGCDALDFVYVL